MALSRTVFFTNILAAGPELQGFSSRSVVGGISNALAEWFTTPGYVTIVGQATGNPGPLGQINGTLALALSGFPFFDAAFKVGLRGPTAMFLIKAVIGGITQTINTVGQYRGAVSGVAVGQDVATAGSVNEVGLITLLRRPHTHGTLISSLVARQDDLTTTSILYLTC